MKLYRRILQRSATLNDVRNFAELRAWTIVECDETEELTWITWRGDNEAPVSLNYVRDGLRGFCYVIFSGEHAVRYVEQFEAAVMCVSLAALLDAWRSACTVEHYILVLPMLGIAAPPSWVDDVYSAIQQGFVHADIRVRLVAIWSAGATAWPEWAPSLLILKEGDPSPDVREAASGLLNALGVQESSYRDNS